MMGQEVGRVYGEPRPLSYHFKAAAGVPLMTHDYVVAEVIEYENNESVTREVLGEIMSLTSKSPLATEEMSAVFTSEEYTYKIGKVKVLGYLNNQLVYLPRTPVMPNATVYLAPKEMLQSFFAKKDGKALIPVGHVLMRPDVPIAVDLNEMARPGLVAGSTRSGKSFAAGTIIERILRETPFPVVVLDVHNDYVYMNQKPDGTEAEGYNVVVYHPVNAKLQADITATKKELVFPMIKTPAEELMAFFQTTGELQEIYIRNIIRELKAGKKPFDLEDIIKAINDKLSKTDSEGRSVIKREDHLRWMHLRERLEDLNEEPLFKAAGIEAEEFFKPKTLSVISLNGLRASIQDVYASHIINMLLHKLMHDRGKEEVIFLFVEEAHRMVSPDAKKFSVDTIKTAVREGAKFGLFITLITQSPSAIDPGVIANVGNFMVFRLINEKDKNIIIEASETVSQDVVNDLPSLNVGEAAMVGDFVPISALVKVTGRTTKHGGMTPDLKRIADRLNSIKDDAPTKEW
jgi:DNA helicase HerA-like ATPase